MKHSGNMPTDGHLKDPLTTTSRRRRTLSNITNLSLSGSWVSDAKEGLKAKTSIKGSSFAESQLREENTALKRLLSEKDATIEKQAAQLDQMQKEFVVQVRRQAQVNEELISYNSRLSKDGGQLRDQLKLLQHEYCQMTVAYRVNQSELQVKLAESQELLTRLLEQADNSSTDQLIPTKLPKKPRSSSAHRRHSICNITIEEDWNGSTNLDSRRQQEDGAKRSDFSRRPSSVSKETTSGSRQTEQQADNPPAPAHIRTPSTNLYCDLIGLDPMPEGSCEDDYDSPHPSTSEEASSNAGDESCKSGTSGSGRSSEATSRRSKSSSSEFAACGKTASQSGTSQLGNTRKANQRVSSSVSSSVPAPHFSRRVAINNNLCTENGRPIRRAVVKVASYTEPSSKTKMRRPY